jgi:hypothetical protein
MDPENTQVFGKRQEFMAIAMLMAMGYDVYLTLVDNQQIDCVVRHKDPEGKLTYYDIQIKARSKAAQRKSWATWPNLKILEPRKNFYVIFYSEPLKEYWVVPSKFLAEHAIRGKDERHQDHYTVTLAKCNEGLPTEHVSVFETYRGAFDRLGLPDPDEAADEVPSARRAARRDR